MDCVSPGGFCRTTIPTWRMVFSVARLVPAKAAFVDPLVVSGLAVRTMGQSLDLTDCRHASRGNLRRICNMYTEP
jgi:hypothetical protein